MGLSIVKKIIEKEGGSIWVKSQVEQGTTFRFKWPKRMF
ncbi:ATP-binding protein [Leptodesmis sp.]